VSRLSQLRRKLSEPRESRGYVMRWGCPGDGCDGLFRTSRRADEHGWVARTIGSHEAAPQRRFLRKRDRIARDLRRRGVAR
jgi:hypothetical protein